MKNRSSLLITYWLFTVCSVFSQNNNIEIDAAIDPALNVVHIKQRITYFNKSNKPLSNIYFHNWANAFKDKNTPLAKRFVENYNKAFHFAKEKNRGFTDIKGISVNYETSIWQIPSERPDILVLNLKETLKPADSVVIEMVYDVKIPRDRYTGYGFNTDEYNLKYWYIIPAVNRNGVWKTYSHLDMDDLYSEWSNYNIVFKVPENYILNSELVVSESTEGSHRSYTLKGENRPDVELNLSKNEKFTTFEFDDITIVSNLDTDKLNHNLKESILKREFFFLQYYLGSIPQKELLLNRIEYDKNPVYGFSQLPSVLAPFSNAFEWDIEMFKVLTKKYIDHLFQFNMREDNWLADGMQTYLMMKYVEKYYPEIKAIGEISSLWGIRNFNLAKIDFNEKYGYVYQFAARKNLDQPLKMRADSLSNFNRKIVNKYKAGLGLKYLEAYLEVNTLKELLFDFSNTHKFQHTDSNDFLIMLKAYSEKDLSWFENDFLHTNKKVDYTIKRIEKKNDSLEVTILNKRAIDMPVQLYGINKNEIKFKKWLKPIDSIAKVTIPTNGFDKLSLNYEFLMPEYNLRNNWKSVKRKVLNRPIQAKFLLDIENPYYNQFFYTPVVRYNYYDGVVMGLALSNKTVLNKSFQYKFTPSYSSKSKSFSGSYAMMYEHLPENKKVNKFLLGFSGSNYHYAEDLTYNSMYPFALVEFKRKSLRDVSSKSLLASYAIVDRERAPDLSQHPETTSYNIFNLSYGYSKPEIIEDIRFSTGFQIANKFSKVSLTARYRKLTNTNRQLDFRFFAGAFISNKTETDYFSFALDRPTDYLFQYDYLGRSETSGIFSQQIIINEGGFKSKLPVPYANQWLTTFNTSIGLWRWFEIYNDVGFVKNKNENVYFAREHGVRLNFIQDILELYFPMYSNLGWEISQANYSSKIRFVLVIKPKRIYNFIRRGFY